MPIPSDGTRETTSSHGPAWRCPRFWLCVLPPMWPALAAYALGYVFMRLAARIRIWGASSQVGPVRIGGRLIVSAASLFRFYEPLISWEIRRRAR